MSGFDDLLQQSSRALEENPFEDPFAPPRASSPDPWSSYGHQSATVGSPAFEYDSAGFGGLSTSTQAVQLDDDTLSSSAVESNAFVAQAASSDPLDSANLPADDEPEFTTKPMTSPRYSDFKEIVGTVPHTAPSQSLAVASEPVSEPDSSRTASGSHLSITLPLESSPVQPPSPVTPLSTVPQGNVEHTGPPSPPQPSSARLPQRQEAPHPSVHLPFDSSSLTVSDSHHVISTPLDQPPITPFSSLALGGESFNGWDGAQSSFINNASFPSSTQEDDDDDEDDEDDDKPLRPRPVSTDLYCSSSGAIHRRSYRRRPPLKRRKPGYNPYSQLLWKIPRRLGTLSVRSQCIQFTPRHVPSESGSVSAVVSLFSRLHHRISPTLRSPFFAVIRIFYGCTRPSRSITLGWLFLRFLRKAPSDASMISSFGNGGQHLRIA